jgi:hypothetical protein
MGAGGARAAMSAHRYSGVTASYVHLSCLFGVGSRGGRSIGMWQRFVVNNVRSVELLERDAAYPYLAACCLRHSTILHTGHASTPLLHTK